MAGDGSWTGAILRAGYLSQDWEPWRSWDLAPDRCWLFAVEDGTLELSSRHERQSFRPGEVAMVDGRGDWRAQLGRGGRFLHVAFRTTVDPPADDGSDDGHLRWRNLILPIAVPPDLFQEVTTAMQLIRGDYWRHPGGYLRAVGHLARLLGALFSHRLEIEPDRPGREGCSPLVGQALTLLHEHHYGLTCRQVAGLLDLSPDHLSRLVKRDTGMAFATYRDRRRRDTTARLIADSRLALPQVAARTGHRDAGSLARAVRRWFGCTPTELRRRMVRYGE